MVSPLAPIRWCRNCGRTFPRWWRFCVDCGSLADLARALIPFVVVAAAAVIATWPIWGGTGT